MRRVLVLLVCLYHLHQYSNECVQVFAKLSKFGGALTGASTSNPDCSAKLDGNLAQLKNVTQGAESVGEFYSMVRNNAEDDSKGLNGPD